MSAGEWFGLVSVALNALTLIVAASYWAGETRGRQSRRNGNGNGTPEKPSGLEDRVHELEADRANVWAAIGGLRQQVKSFLQSS